MGRRCIEQYSFPIEFILDNDINKSGIKLDGLIIKTPCEVNLHEYFIIVAVAKSSEIEKQLTELGLVKNLDYILF